MVGGRIGLAAHAPNLEVECVLYCFLTVMVGGALAHAPNVEAECVLYCFLPRMVGGGPHCPWLAPGRLGEGVFINKEQ